MGWCDDPRSRNYNQLINLPSNYRHEKLFKKENIYDIILVLNYNMRPIKKNKGSAIFIHVSKKNFKKTEGCVAIQKRYLLKIVKEIKKNTKDMIENQKYNYLSSQNLTRIFRRLYNPRTYPCLNFQEQVTYLIHS